jgi:hypothetical protein
MMSGSWPIGQEVPSAAKRHLSSATMAESGTTDAGSPVKISTSSGIARRDMKKW